MSRDVNAQPATGAWTSTQAYVMAVICLLIGIAVGYFVRGSATGTSAPPATASAAPNVSGPIGMGGMGQQQPTPDQLKRMADTQAAPLLARLNSEPNNAQLLAEIGNMYYDAQQYSTAIDYYGRSLKIRPTDTNVRTDMGTAMWYLGDADKAIEQFNVVLKAEPTKANTLLNLGVVKWQGKMDVPGAVAAWEKLLATNPNFEGKDKVQDLIAQAKKHENVKPGTKTDKPTM